MLRRRAAYHAGLFGAFSMFWTVVPLVLEGERFQLSQAGIALFALVGMAGAVASPVAGKLADQGYTLPATAAALLLGILGFALPLWMPDSRAIAIGMLVIASIVLDMGVAANLVLGQRACCPGRRSTQPLEWHLFRAILRRRRPGLGDRRLGAGKLRLARRPVDGHRLPGRCTALLDFGSAGIARCATPALGSYHSKARRIARLMNNTAVPRCRIAIRGPDMIREPAVAASST